MIQIEDNYLIISTIFNLKQLDQFTFSLATNDKKIIKLCYFDLLSMLDMLIFQNMTKISVKKYFALNMAT